MALQAATSSTVTSNRAHLLRATLIVVVLALSSCGSTPWQGGNVPAPYGVDSGVEFRAVGDYFEINRGDGWEEFLIKSVNVTASVPGTVPGELAAAREDYDLWLELLAEMNVNVVRVYTLHHPRFYHALASYNLAHPDRPIYLIQGIWLDEIEEELDGTFHGDYISDRTEQMHEETRYVINALHGRESIEPGPPRWGKAFGTYTADVSSFVVAWLPGSEMLGNIVAESHAQFPTFTSYDGKYVSEPDGKPIEAWVASILDDVIDYEQRTYGVMRPVAFSSWPALDPMDHPTESSRFSQDTVNADFADYDIDPAFDRGIFVNYHVYPFNPEFIIFDPVYRSVTDADGNPNPYLGYLLDLKAHHPGVPLFIGEFGIPSSLGVAHVNDLSWNHGGYDEWSQADAVPDMWRDIVQSGCAGGAVFEIMDEWFKKTWMTNPTTQPADRAKLWLDVLNPEEHFGIFSFYPIPGMGRRIDGDGSDWVPEDVLYTQSSNPVTGIADGHDPSRTLEGLSVTVDPAYLFLRIDTGATGPPDLSKAVYFVGISTVGGATGDTRWPGLSTTVQDSLGMEALLAIDAAQGRVWLLIDDEYDISRRVSGESRTGGKPVLGHDGTFIMSRWIMMNDEQYIEEGIDVPEARKMYFEPGRLRIGDSVFDTLAHFMPGEDGVMEVRIPWHAMWISDPSSHHVIWDESEGYAPLTVDCAQSDEMRLMLVSAARDDSDNLTLTDAMPRAALVDDVFQASGVPAYRWDLWDEPPPTQLRLKPLYAAMKKAYAGGTP